MIGLTNRKDLIDEAILRPGRFEVHIEIGLPDLKGRKEIFLLHTKKLRDNQILNEDVDIDLIAEKTENMTGACLLYTSPSPRDRQKSRMPSSA